MPWFEEVPFPVQANSESLILDFDGAGLEIASGVNGFLLRAFDSPPPTRKRVLATSQDMEGSTQVDSNYDNRTFTMTVRVLPAVTRSAWYNRLNVLQSLCSRACSEGITLARTALSGTQHYYDVTDLECDITWDTTRYALNMDMDVTFKGEAKPFLRSTEIAGDVFDAGALSYLTFTENTIQGDVPALARLRVTNLSLNKQNYLVWGVESRYAPTSDPSNLQGLYYEAEGRTFANGSVVAGSGVHSGSVVRTNTLTIAYLPIISTLTPVSNLQLAHVGDYRIFVRVWVPSANTSLSYVRLQWAQADWSDWTTNAEKLVDVRDHWQLVDLGIINIESAFTGALQQWIGEIEARADAPASCTVDFDSIFLVPVTEGSADVTASLTSDNPYVPTPPPVIFPGEQLEVNSDRVIRQSSDGVSWGAIEAEGDYLRVPPSGYDSRSARFFVKSSAGYGDRTSDDTIDRITAQLFYTPRWLMHPDS